MLEYTTTLSILLLITIEKYNYCPVLVATLTQMNGNLPRPKMNSVCFGNYRNCSKKVKTSVQSVPTKF